MNNTMQAIPMESAPRRLYIRTFGCQMNEYDSLRVERMLAPRGYTVTADMESADLIFINTCSVREKAEQKIHSFLGRLRRLKRARPHLIIVVAGCVAQQLGSGLRQRFEHLDLVLGTRGVAALPRLLDGVEASGKGRAHLPECEEASEDYWASAPWSSAVSEPVTIMQGCDNFCTYCIVPYVRGREKSRPSGEILGEIRLLLEGGAREILLLGQNVNSYGKGLDEEMDFPGLLRRIAHETDLTRLRFTTSHPKDLTENLILAFRDLPCLCKHLHLPLQAGSNRILERMNRRYSAARYLEKIDRLREACPDIGLSSDVMVGFPGETEADFKDTLGMLERIRFDTVFSFRYSDRPFAASSRFPDKVPEDVKARRLVELQNLQAHITLERNRSQVGRVHEILVEGPSRAAQGQLTGRTEQNHVVNFEGSPELVGQTVRVEIQAGFSHSLKGRLV